MQQQIILVEPINLLNKVALMKKDGCRLVQILCTRVEEGYELTYSFDKDYFLYNLRVIAPEHSSVMSITSQYWYAFVWENEIHDLFGLRVEFIAPEVDYGGHFFHLAEETPWNVYEASAKAPGAMKVNLRSGLGIDAATKPAAKPAEAAKPVEAAKPEAAKVSGGEQNG